MHVKHKAIYGSTLSALLLLAVCHSAIAQYGHLTISGPPGGFAGPSGYADVLYTPATSLLFIARVRGTLSNGQPAKVEFDFLQPTTPDNFSTLIFGTDKLGIPIQPGIYTNAQFADTASLGTPGLDIGFGHQSINQFPGSFTISDVNITRDVTSDTGYKINSFAATFAEPNARLSGTFAYNAVGSAPPPIVLTPESSGLTNMSGALLALGLVWLVMAVKKKKAVRSA